MLDYLLYYKNKSLTHIGVKTLKEFNLIINFSKFKEK